ncbi:MAG: exported protein of unknown function [Promethearchaeota archaeon]|nr:MAG: exported protein of unknown function [Candidatus Lokiarchaeota archaeon]
MKKKLAFSVCILTYFLIFSGFVINSSISNNERNLHNPLKSSAVGPTYSNVSIISDGYAETYWNDDYSLSPSLAVDDEGNIHAVWADATVGPWTDQSIDREIMYAKFSSESGWSNATVISDGFGGSYWNDAQSLEPSIAVDNEGGLHVVWEDWTDGSWRKDDSDCEIMYVKYTPGSGWSNVTVVSDGYADSYWNTGYSYHPSIGVDEDHGVHIVWEDWTTGSWGDDREIMYVKFTPGSGWSNVTIISDGYGGNNWNNESSTDPDLAIDNQGNIHVVWRDSTPGSWTNNDFDTEIMYAVYTLQIGWSFPKVISDGYKGSYWNDGNSGWPSVAVDNTAGVHIAWTDYTEGPWETDSEIMYVDFTPGVGWSNATVVSDSYGGNYLNNGSSIKPSIGVDKDGKIHVVWEDSSNNPLSWGSDWEIMYSVYTPEVEWSFPIVISDGYEESYWNSGDSIESSLAVDNQGKIHVAWRDKTEGYWRANTDDDEIMYATVESPLDSGNAPGAFTLNSNADDPDDDGVFYLSWTEAKNADEYSVIIKKNGTSEILGSGLIDRTFPVMGLKNGTYSFEIEASNEYGTTTSNQVNVTVKIPSIYQNKNQNNETQEDESSSIPFGNHYLGILIMGVVSLVVIVYYKQKK